MASRVLLIALLLAGCGDASHTSNPQSREPMRPTSTAAVSAQVAASRPIEMMETLYFSEGPPALYVRYRTPLALDDTVALLREARSMLEQAQPEAQRRKLGVVVVAALSGTGGFNFVFNRVDGEWVRAGKSASKADER